MSPLLLLLGTATLAASLFVLFRRLHSSSSLPLPPGPKPLPLIGNAHQMPTSHEWLTFKTWGDKYGDVCSVNVFGKRMIILNSAKAIEEIMEKRAAMYIDRPHLTFAGDLVGHYDLETLSTMKYSEAYKKSRKLFQHTLSPRAAQEYWPSQTKEFRQLMGALLKAPKDYEEHIGRAVIAVLFMLTYGYQIQGSDDRFVWLGKKNAMNFAKATMPGAWLVDSLPFLRHIPSWVPGAGFQRIATLWKSEWSELIIKPFELVKREMAAGTARPSFTTRLLEDTPDDATTRAEYERLVMLASATIYGSGADTSVSAILTFFLAMMTHPDAQAKAQEEIDEVVGRDRMPTFEDRDRLVYCNALMKECLRWEPVAPLSFPHAGLQDDMYDGYAFPKGSTVVGNMWATAYDPVVYPSPEKFKPERFLSPDGKSPQVPEGVRDSGSYAFGFGRRVCPGQSIAEGSMYMAVVNTLWTFNISHPTGPDGKPIKQELDYVSGIIRRPKPFACDIKPRSAHAVEIVKQAVWEVPSAGGKAL